VKLIGHSQAGAIISSATGYLTPEERGRIDLTTFGGAAWTYPGGFHSHRNVVNVADFVVADWAGNGALAFQGPVGFWLAMSDPNLDYTFFLDDGLHGFRGYWENDQKRHDPVLRNRLAAEAERRRHEMAMRNWDKR
jgi:hypothetical protein